MTDRVAEVVVFGDSGPVEGAVWDGWVVEGGADFHFFVSSIVIEVSVCCARVRAT